MPVLIRGAEVEGRRRDVRLDGGRVIDLGERLPDAGAEIVDADGGALVPGLHDHHLHLFALAAARQSVDVGDGLEALSGAPGPWVRGVNARDSVDRHALDRLVSDRPVRVQHRSGGLWMLNTAALAAVERVLDSSPDVERDETGVPTGRLWRYDARLRPALPSFNPDLASVVTELHGYGITAVTDATPDLDAGAIDTLSRLPMDLTLLGDPGSTAPVKLLLHDHDLPSYDELRSRIETIHGACRAVAVHCVTRESLLLTLAALDEAGRHPADRIEHAAVVPPEARSRLRGLTVVTQPAFVTTRENDYRRWVEPRDQPYLYPYASLLGERVNVLPSSDAPYGPVDPWSVVRAARDRELVPAEQVGAATTLDGYFRDGRGRRNRVVPGAAGGWALLHVPLREALHEPDRSVVRRTFAPSSDARA